jgi:hypothetical protein
LYTSFKPCRRRRRRRRLHRRGHLPRPLEEVFNRFFGGRLKIFNIFRIGTHITHYLVIIVLIIHGSTRIIRIIHI